MSQRISESLVHQFRQNLAFKYYWFNWKTKIWGYIYNNINCLDFSNVEKLNLEKYIGYIFQNNQLLEDFTVLENVALPLILNGENYNKALAKALSFLELFGLKKNKI